jgi:hypothetical protein
VGCNGDFIGKDGDVGGARKLSRRAEGLDGKEGLADMDLRKSLNPAKPFGLFGFASADAVLGEGNEPEGMMNGESDGEGSRTRETERSELVDFEGWRTVADAVIVLDESDARNPSEDELEIVLACRALDEGRCETGVFMIFLNSSSSRGVRSCRPVDARHRSVNARGGDIGLEEKSAGVDERKTPLDEIGGVPSDADLSISPAAAASSLAMVIRRVRGLLWSADSDDTRAPLSARPVLPTRTRTLAIAHSSRNS